MGITSIRCRCNGNMSSTGSSIDLEHPTSISSRHARSGAALSHRFPETSIKAAKCLRLKETRVCTLAIGCKITDILETRRAPDLEQAPCGARTSISNTNNDINMALAMLTCLRMDLVEWAEDSLGRVPCNSIL